MRRLLAILLLLALPPAGAQEGGDPDLNESDMNTTVPDGDTSYLNETNSSSSSSATNSSSTGSGAGSSSGSANATDDGAAADPTLSEGDMDTSLPDTDTSYLDENEAPPATDDGAGGTSPTRDTTGGSASTPGFGALALLAGAGALALALRRR